MKIFKNIYVCFIVISVSNLISCENALDIEPSSEFSSSFIRTENGIISVLNSAYNNIHYNAASHRISSVECTTDLLANYRGGMARQTQHFQEFTLNAQHRWIKNEFWIKPYEAVRDANVVLQNLEDVEGLSQEERDKISGETKFVRALAYKILNNWFGEIPLIIKAFESTDDEGLYPSKATEEELFDFIESELLEAASLLPEDQDLSGKATKGAALGVLAKFYLQKRQWAKAVETSKDVMDMGKYGLVEDFFELWALDNENNKEMIYVFPATVENKGNSMLRNLLPPKYPTDCQNAATQVVVPVEFYYEYYEPADIRNDFFITEYTTTDGEFINLLEGNEFQNPRHRYGPIDPECTNVTNRDYPYLRYADILLTRAEGLVMASGSVTQEAIDLLNRTRNRAGLPDLTMSDLPDQATFIDHLLRERAVEFIREAQRRKDLIRHDRYIDNAIARGKNAMDFHKKWPIPSSEIDANPNLEQNPGY